MVLDAGRIKHLGDLMHKSIASNGSAVSSNWKLSADGLTNVVWTPEGAGGSVSYGSNSNEVTYANAPGTISLSSHADHLHRGVTSLAHASNTYTGPVTLETEGGLYIVRSAANTYRLGSTGGTGGGGGTTITTKDEGSTLSTGVTTLDFVGSGVTASGAGATTTVTIAGGGGGTMQYPALKPGTPTYDFAGASLDGAFSAHSSGGTFVTGNCLTQGEDWMGSALEIQFSAQMGALYVSHSNTDFDFSVGGMRLKGPINPTCMVGIAALDSAGTGVGLVAYNDTTMYLATITTWNYVANSDNWAANGLATGTPYQGDYWFRLKRVSGTWTAYASKSGRVWDKTFTTRADTITVDRLAFGLFYNTGSTYSMRVTADYFQVDV